MNNQPYYSVIIPVYNIEKYIGKCIDSILQQANNNFEVILVDDGSKDDSPKICDRYAEMSPLVHVIHTENHGVSFARNTGLSNASGKYIIFIDGDDYIADGCFAKIESVINENKPDIVVFKALYGNGDDYIPYPVKYKCGFYNKQRIREEIFPSLIQDATGNYFPPSLWGKVIKKQLVKNHILIAAGVVMGEDGACTIPCIYHANSMVLLDEYFYFYRLNNASATKSRKPLSWDWSKLVYYHLTQHIDLEAFDFEAQIQRKIVHDLFQIIRSQYYEKRPISIINKDIKLHLEDSIYKNAINGCEFSRYSAAGLMHLCLRKHLFFIFYLYTRVKG